MKYGDVSKSVSDWKEAKAMVCGDGSDIRDSVRGCCTERAQRLHGQTKIQHNEAREIPRPDVRANI